MKKVRLFAVAAAMGMFASSVSAATQIGPVVTKTSGSFAWGEFASVMKVDMGDKVVAPQVTVTATTEGRTTDIDYATYKTATGLVKNSTCYVGFTNTAAKDTNIDGLADQVFFMSDAEVNSAGKYYAFGSVEDLVTDMAGAGEAFYGDVVLAPGQAEIDEVYRVWGTDKQFSELEEVFDYLEEEGYFTVTYADDLIVSVSLASKTFYMFDKDGNELESQPLGTVSGTFWNTSTRAKDSTTIKEDVATIFLNIAHDNADKVEALQELAQFGGMTAGNAALLTDVTAANLGKVFGTSYTMTTGSAFVTGMAEVTAGNVAAGAVSSTNPYLEDYAYYASSQYNKGELIVGATATPVTAKTIADQGFALVVEYTKYDTYEPDATKTAALNADITEWTAAIIGAAVATDVKAKITATNVDALIAASTNANIAGVDNALAADRVTAVKGFITTDAIAEQLIEDYFYATYHLDFHPETDNAKNTFVMPGFVSVIEYDASNRRTADYSVLVAPKKQAKVTKTYATISNNVFNAETAGFDAVAKTKVIDGVAITDIIFANKATDADDTNEAVFYKNPYALATEADGDVTYPSYKTIYDSLYGVGQVGSYAYPAMAPENDTDYIVINMPVNKVLPISRSLSKMTANYKNSVTGEEIMTHLVELDTNDGTRGSYYYPAVETKEDAIKFLETVYEVYSSADYYVASGYNWDATDFVAATYTWADGTTAKMRPNSYLSSPATTQCTYSTNKGSDVKTEAASVSFDASKVDTTKAGVYTATLTAKAGETTETKDVTVVVAPKYSRTWDNKGRVSTLKAYWLSGNLYAEYKYTYNADNTITVVSTFYREDGVTVADTATTTK